MTELNLAMCEDFEKDAIRETFKKLELKIMEITHNNKFVIKGTIGEFEYTIKNNIVYIGEKDCTQFMMEDIYQLKENVYRPYDFMFNIVFHYINWIECVEKQIKELDDKSYFVKCVVEYFLYKGCNVESLKHS